QTQFAWHARLHNHTREVCAQNSRRAPFKYGKQVRRLGRVLAIKLPVPAGVEAPGIPPGEKASVRGRSFEWEVHKCVHRPVVRLAILAAIRLEAIVDTGRVMSLVTCLVRSQRGANVQRPSQVHVRILFDEDGGLTSLESDRGAIEACTSGR